MLLAGGYGSDAARLALVELDQRGSGEAAAMLATRKMPLRLAGSERSTLLTGRGDILHLIDGDRWHRCRVGMPSLPSLIHRTDRLGVILPSAGTDPRVRSTRPISRSARATGFWRG